MDIIRDLCLMLLFLFVLIKYILLHISLIKQKKYFIKTLSHDFRVATIAQIRGVELLQKNNHSEFNQELISEIKESALYSLDMLTMLINTYRYSRGELVLNKKEFSFSKVLNKILPKFEEKFFVKNLTLKCLNAENSILYGDIDELQKVLCMIITVALDNSEKNSKLFLKISKNKNYNKILINYKGNPLTNEEYKRMFDKNSRFSTVGHGIKMHYCKKIIEFHNGKINFSSNSNDNFFTITLPAKRVPNSFIKLCLNNLQLVFH